MSIRTAISGLLALAVGTAAGAAAAEAQNAKPQAEVRYEIQTPVRFVSGRHTSAKFLEYRDIPNGLSIDLFTLGYRRAGQFLGFNAKNPGQDGQTLTLTGGEYGRYRVGLRYDSIPHRFAYGALSIFDGVGSGVLTVKPGVRAAIVGPTATDRANQAQGVFNTLAQSVDLELTRKTTGADLTMFASESVTVRMGASREKREGTRPFMGSLGFGSAGAIELPEPINYETSRFNMSAEYARGGAFLSAAFANSSFDNNTGTLTWDNPFQTADTTATPARSLLDLYPDNRASSFTLTGAASRLPMQTTLSAVVSRGTMKQNDSFVAHTVNSAIASPALPADSLNGKVDTTLINVVATSRPVKDFTLRGRYRLYDYDNKTPELTFPSWVAFDGGGVRNTAITAEPRSYKTSAGTFEAEYAISPTASLSWEKRSQLIKRNTMPTPRSVERGDTFSLLYRPGPSVNFRAFYENAHRMGDTQEWESPEMRWLQVYDEANRKTSRRRIEATVYPSDNVTLVMSSGFTHYGYEDSAFGRQRDRRGDTSLEMDWQMTPDTSMYMFYTHEKYSLIQRDRQWVASGSGDPYVSNSQDSLNNWDSQQDDTANTLGLGLKGDLIPRRLGWDLSYWQTRSTGNIAFSSRISPASLAGVTSTNPVAWTSVDDSTLLGLNAALTYEPQPNISLGLGFQWEKFRMSDYAKDGFVYVPATAAGAYNGALLMDTLPGNYSAHIFYAKLSYRF